LRRAINALLTLVLLSLVAVSVAGQAGRPISVSLGTGLPMTIGRTSTIVVAVANIVNSTVQLTFVGLRWPWMGPTSFFIGNSSEKGAVLLAGAQIKYSILVSVPSNATAGTQTLTTAVSYRWFKGGNWTGVISDVWVSNVPLAYPPSQSATPTPIQTTGAPSPQTFDLPTIAVLVAVVAIGLFLERRRIRDLAGRFRKRTSERSVVEKMKPEVPIEKPRVKRKSRREKERTED